MNNNAEVIHRFYKAFQQLDYKTMQSCYAGDAVFNDPVFGLLQGDEVKSMWEMLCRNAKNFSLEYNDIKLLDDEYATCNWTAQYTFSKTGRQVINNIKAHLRIKNGQIIEHTDAFNLAKWCKQALGLPGLLFGRTGWMQQKIQKQAKASLKKFMEANRA